MGCGTGGWGASSSPDRAQGQDRVEISVFVCGLTKRQNAVDSLELVRLDQTKMGDRHGTKRPLWPSTLRPAEYGGMFQTGIINPAMVMRAALQEVANLLIVTEAMVAELPNKAPIATQGQHGPLKLDCYERCQKARYNTRLHRSRAMRSYGLAYSRGYRGVRRLRCVPWRSVNHA